MIVVKSFKAQLHPRECKTFIVEHTKVLQVFDIANITSASTDWAFSPGSVIITVKDTNNDMIAGGRIQIANGELALPIEDAVGDMDNSIYEVIKKHAKNGGTGEFCGLWNTRKAAKMGLGSYFLVSVITAVASQVNIKSLFALCAPTTIKIAKRVGFLTEEYLGEKGTFYYPKLDLVATVMKLPNILTLDHANANEKNHIFGLRKDPFQEQTEILRRQEITIQYDLIIQ